MDWRRNKELKDFYSHVIDNTKKDWPLEPGEKIGFIVANHTTQEMLPMLEAFGEIGEVIGFVPKSSEKDKRAEHAIKTKYEVDTHVNKCNLRDPECATKYIEEKIKNFDGKVILIDDGGYFAPSFSEISHHPEIAEKLLGVIEGTENGHQKYELTAPLAQHPVISKARSPNKKPEDKQVGRSLIKMSDHILMEAHTKQIEDMDQIGVIGLGKVGMAAALELNQRGQRPYVWDLDPSLLAEASAHGLRVAPSLEVLLEESDMIFSATGKQAIRGDAWNHMKDGAIVACCTSADDEIDLEGLKQLSESQCFSAEVDRYNLPNGKTVQLLNHGNSVNFYQGRGVVSSALSLSLAEYHTAATQLVSADQQGKLDEVFPVGKVIELDKKTLRDTASIWLSHFTEYDLPDHLKCDKTIAEKVSANRTRTGVGHVL